MNAFVQERHVRGHVFAPQCALSRAAAQWDDEDERFGSGARCRQPLGQGRHGKEVLAGEDPVHQQPIGHRSFSGSTPSGNRPRTQNQVSP